jgi:glycosyltransferase 2 family protein
MLAWWKQWWPALKFVLGLAIIAVIGVRFAQDLQDPGLRKASLRPGWMVLSGVLYLLALGCSVLIWYRLLRSLGQRPAVARTVRAYFLGQLGKYLPGKAWSLLLRAAMAAGPGVRAGLAGLTSFYEVLVTMATGVLMAAVVFCLLGPANAAPMDGETLRKLFRLEEPGAAARDWKVLVLLALILLAPLAVVILPPVFNRLAHRLARPFREPDAPPLPPFRWRTLAQGAALATCFWFLLSASLWCMLEAVLSRPPQWTPEGWALDTAYLGVAYVAGFVILLVPSGIGVREFFLALFLASPEEGRSRPAILLAVLALRLVWTTAELLVALVVYKFPGPAGDDTVTR